MSGETMPVQRPWGLVSLGDKQCGSQSVEVQLRMEEREQMRS